MDNNIKLRDFSEKMIKTAKALKKYSYGKHKPKHIPPIISEKIANLLEVTEDDLHLNNCPKCLKSIGSKKGKGIK